MISYCRAKTFPQLSFEFCAALDLRSVNALRQIIDYFPLPLLLGVSAPWFNVFLFLIVACIVFHQILLRSAYFSKLVASGVFLSMSVASGVFLMMSVASGVFFR